METITKEIYYHINTGKKLLIGDTLDIGNTYNNFYHEIYNTEYLNNNKDANECLLEMQKNKTLTFKNVTEANLVFKTVNDSAMITRELIFEEARKEINPELPSRFKCLYVCQNINEINNWLEIFKRTDKTNIQIVKLELTGNIFCGDASLILRQNISLNKKKEQAKKYWNGIKDKSINEYLFIGTARVIDIIEKI